MVRMDVLGALRRSWWLLVVLGAVGLVVGVLLPVSHQAGPPTGASTLAWQARTVVGTAPKGGGNQVAGDVTAAQIQFYGASVVVKRATAEAAGLDVPVSRYASYFSATVVHGGGGAATVVLTARGRTKAGATALATAYAKQLGDYLTFLATTSAVARAGAGGTVVAGHTGYQVLQVATATSTSVSGPSSGSAGTRWARGIIGLLIGLVLAVVAALVRERLDQRLRNADRARASFGFPVVVEIPVAAAQNPAVPGQYPMVDVVRNPNSAGAEAYRMLRMSLLFEPAPTPVPPAPDEQATGPAAASEPAAEPALPAEPAEPAERQIILVASAGNEITRPHVAANLAAIYGEAGQKVVVISTWDIEAVTAAADIPEVPGSDRIRPRDVEAQIEPSRLDHVYRLSMTPFVAGSAQLVSRGGLLLDAARSVCDVVIVDVPPMLALHHAEALSHSVDVVLVVGECGFTTLDEARRAGDLLRRIGAPVLGVVLTNVPLPAGDIRQTVPRHHPDPDPDPATATATATASTEVDEEPVAVAAGATAGAATAGATASTGAAGPAASATTPGPARRGAATASKPASPDGDPGSAEPS